MGIQKAHHHLQRISIPQMSRHIRPRFAGEPFILNLEIMTEQQPLIRQPWGYYLIR